MRILSLGRSWRSRGSWLLGLGAVLLAMIAPARAQERGDAVPTFFDPVVTIAPGISRELDFFADHIRAGDERLTSMSAKLQYPVLSWLQFSLEMPVLIIPSVQVNIRAGALPEPEENGVSYLKVPLNLLGRAPEARR